MNKVTTTSAPAAIGPYSQAWEHAGLVFASGQLPVCPKTGEMPEGIAAQAAQSAENVKAILEAAGSSCELPRRHRRLRRLQRGLR